MAEVSAKLWASRKTRCWKVSTVADVIPFCKHATSVAMSGLECTGSFKRLHPLTYPNLEDLAPLVQWPVVNFKIWGVFAVVFNTLDLDLPLSRSLVVARCLNQWIWICCAPEFQTEGFVLISQVPVRSSHFPHQSHHLFEFFGRSHCKLSFIGITP